MRKFPVAALFSILALAGLGLQWSGVSDLSHKCSRHDQHGSDDKNANYLEEEKDCPQGSESELE